MNANRRRLVAGAVIVAVAVLVWFLAVILVPVFEDRACAGVEFRAPADAQPPPTKRERPPIGGTGGLAGELREALRGGGPVVYCSDLADPYILRAGDSYDAYSTNTEDFHVPVLTSGGLLSGARGDRSEALAQLPGWAIPGKVWAPSVLARPGGFVLYYVTTAANPERQCISRAVSAEPTGFVDDSTEPLVCPAHGGGIDPSPVVAPDGRAYLLWKQYGVTDGIVAQELAADGLSLVGSMQVLLEADQGWEGGLIEAPSMVGADGRYYLFYSGNDWAGPNYAVGYAVCDLPLGPCTKAPGPWLASTDKAQGPGGQEAFTDEQGRYWLVLHAWVRGKVGYPHGARNLFVLQLDFVNGAPVAT